MKVTEGMKVIENSKYKRAYVFSSLLLISLHVSVQDKKTLALWCGICLTTKGWTHKRNYTVAHTYTTHGEV